MNKLIDSKDGSTALELSDTHTTGVIDQGKTLISVRLYNYDFPNPFGMWMVFSVCCMC